jgi:hypothetical protein
MVNVARSCYRVAVALHPATFRERFSVELLETSEYARRDYGVAPLFADILTSLVRQWSLASIDARRGTQACSTLAGSSVLTGRYQSMDATSPRARQVLESSLLVLAMIAPLSLISMMARVAQDRWNGHAAAFATRSITYSNTVRGEPRRD